MLNSSSQSLTDQAYERIKQAILTKRFSHNQKLVYGDLEKMLGMSKTPIVSVLDRLVDEGYIRHQKNFGYFVKQDNEVDPNCEIGVIAVHNLDNSSPTKHLPAFPTLKSSPVTLSQVAYEKLKGLIITQKLVPGQKLIYSDLEHVLGISKTPIVSGLARLESEGLVYLKPNAGYYVKEIDYDEVIDLFEARKAMELANINFVIKNVNGDDLERLEKIHHEYLNHPSPVLDNSRLQVNTKFHLQIALMGKNSFMIKYIEQIYDWFELRMPLTFQFLSHNRVREIDVEHEEIVEAIRIRDRARLEQAFQIHLEAPIKDIAEYLDLGLPRKSPEIHKWRTK